MKRSVITDVYISGGVNPGPGYVPLSSNAIAEPGSTAAAANLTEGIGGRNVWVYVKYEEYDPSDPKKPVPSACWLTLTWVIGVETGISQVASEDMGLFHRQPTALGSQQAPYPGDTQQMQTNRDGRQMGHSRGLNRDPTATYVSRLALARTDNTSPPTWRFDPAMRGTPDVHLGCGDSIAFNIFYRVDEFAKPPRPRGP